MLLTLSPTMRSDRVRRFLEQTLAVADIRLDGERPWDLRINDDRALSRIIAKGSLGLGESYVEGWWDCRELDGLFTRLLRARLDEEGCTPRDWVAGISALLLNRQSPARAVEVAHRHYDLDPELYLAMLGEERVYSCAYWRDSATLADAQRAKTDLVCRKLGLRSGMRVLDIGCGWGAAACHAAREYGVQVIGITISREQAVVARQRCQGLPVTILEQDYRTLQGSFDRIFSIGMFEHVGTQNYRTYLQVVRRCLVDDGLFLLHTIGANRSSVTIDAWIDRYIFPNAVIPSARWITTAAEGCFVIEDWHGFGQDYDRTLTEWHRRLEASWDRLGRHYDREQRRLWRYYLLSCAGSFRARKNQLWQLVLSPHGVPGGYEAVR